MKENVKGSLQELRELRDEIRVKVHLAGMDARQRWEELEPKLREIEGWVERGGDRAATVTNAFLEELGEAFRRIRDRIEQEQDRGERPPAP